MIAGLPSVFQYLPSGKLHPDGGSGAEQPSVTWDELTAKQPAVAEDWDQMERYRQKMGIRIH